MEMIVKAKDDDAGVKFTNLRVAVEYIKGQCASRGLQFSDFEVTPIVEEPAI